MTTTNHSRRRTRALFVLALAIAALGAAAIANAQVGHATVVSNGTARSVAAAAQPDVVDRYLARHAAAIGATAVHSAAPSSDQSDVVSRYLTRQ